VIKHHRPILGLKDEYLANKSLGPLQMISINKGLFRASEDHLFKTSDGWKAVNKEKSELIHSDMLKNNKMTISELKLGDHLITHNNTLILVENIELHEGDDPNLQLYNFKLNGDNTYYVELFKDTFVLVHNKGCFISDTLITLYDETLKPISEIVIGDLVKDALTGNANKVIGIKTIEYEAGEKLFATKQGVKPFITEEHPFYNDKNELCAMSEKSEYLAPWLGKIKVVSVPEIKVNEETQTVYNLMFENGNSHYANEVKVDNIVGSGNLYVLVMKGHLDKESYLGYINHLENTSGLNALTQEQKAKIFFIVRWIGNYVLHHDNLRSRCLAKFVACVVRNRTTLYPWLEKWFKSRLRNWLFGRKK